eukprot:SAG22_NODE_5357_length_1029_cov_1.020430_2_plen_54_part_01
MLQTTVGWSQNGQSKVVGRWRFSRATTFGMTFAFFFPPPPLSRPPARNVVPLAS